MTEKNLCTLAIQLSAEGASADAPVAIPTEFRIFRDGPNTSTKGTVLFDRLAATSTMTTLGMRGYDRIVIDYEHLSLNPSSPGAGKASGWFTPELRGAELWAVNVVWTPAATEALQNKEYAYFSPAVYLDGEGRCVELVNCALTNNPSLDALPQLVAASAVSQDSTTQAAPEVEAPVVEAPAAETPATVDVTAAPEFVELSRKAETTLTELAQAKERIAAFERLELERKVTDTIQAGVASKRVTPAMIPTLQEIGLLHPEWLSRHVASLPVIAALSATSIKTAAVSSYTGKPFNELSPVERADLYARDHDLYQALKAQENGRKSA